jgi:hypothetical protein
MSCCPSCVGAIWPTFQRLYDRLATDGRRMSPDELTAAIGELAPVLA